VSGPDIDALVIGAGVCGLTAAVTLVEAGKRVRIWAAEPPQTTTSVAAGAMWGPYLVEPADRVAVWSQHSLEAFRKLAEQPNTGVRLVAGVEASRTPADPPDWGDRLDGFRMCDAGELPQGFAIGWRFIAPLIDMPTYLAYLQRRLTDAGGVIQSKRISTLEEAAAAAPVVINCTGIGARALVPDPDVMPIRGQLVVVRNPGITEFFSEDTGLSPDLLHFSPHADTVVLGGQAAPCDWNLEPDLELASAIVARCAEVEPRLRGALVIGHRVGLRPTRPEIRVEAVDLGGTLLIHNYGHGGAGVTLSWGCAAEITTLVLGEA
jgi:D-amino-acid oxidase